MAFGTGSAMAHRAVEGLLGPRTVTHEHVTSDGQALAPIESPHLTTVSGANACVNQAKSFEDVILCVFHFVVYDAFSIFRLFK